MKLDTFARSAPAFYRSGNALEIVSGPGVGKSSVMRQIAAKLSKDLGEPFGLGTHILSQLDPMDMKGYLFPIKDKDDPSKLETRFTTPPIFPNLANIEVFEDGELVEKPTAVPAKGMIFLDEFAQSDTDMQKLAAQLILDKRIGEFKLPNGWVTWCAGNRMADKSGVTKRLTFLQNRLKTIEIQSDYKTWEAWANGEGVHHLAVTFAKRYPSQVFQEAVPAEPGPFATPRSLVLCTLDLMAMRTSKHGVERLPDDEVAMEVIQGWLGERAAVDFISHIRVGNELPDIEAVENKPHDTAVPDRVDAQFIMANMLGHHCNKKNAKALMAYAERMDTEMQVLFVAAATQRNPSVLVMDSFNKWISANQDLLLAANQG